MKIPAAKTDFASGGLTCKLGALSFYQFQCSLTVSCSETCPNAKLENLGNDKKN